jgi:MFS transporter, NNP family, nitrate/nitrite transporter
MKRFRSLTGKAILFLLFMWFIWMLNFTTRSILSPVLPLVEDEFGVTHARATSLFIFTALGYAPTVFFSSVYTKILGPRKSVMLSMVLLGLICLAIPLVKLFDLFYVITFILGIGAGLYIPAAIPLLTEYYEEREWGKVIAVHDSGAQISIAVTPFLALLLLLFLPWRGIFLVIGFALLCCAALFWACSEETHSSGSRKYFRWELLKSKPLWIIALMWTFMAGSTMGLYYVAPLYLTKELGLTVQRANAMFGISRIGGAIVGISSGFLVDRFGSRKLVLPLVVVTGLLTALVAVKDVWWTQVFLFAQAAVSAGFYPIALVRVSRMYDAESRGQAVGLMITLGVVGLALFPYLLGVAGDLISFRVGFVALGGLTMLSAGLLRFLKEQR